VVVVLMAGLQRQIFPPLQLPRLAATIETQPAVALLASTVLVVRAAMAVVVAVRMEAHLAVVPRAPKSFGHRPPIARLPGRALVVVEVRPALGLVLQGRYTVAVVVVERFSLVQVVLERRALLSLRTRQPDDRIHLRRLRHLCTRREHRHQRLGLWHQDACRASNL
jgi:hypothetical protein